MRRYSRTAWRWVDAYHRGLDGALANYAVRKSKSHRCVTEKVDRKVNQLAVERKEEAAARAAAADHSPPPVLAALADMTTAGALYDLKRREAREGCYLTSQLLIKTHLARLKKKKAPGQLSCAPHAISNRIEASGKGSVHLAQPDDFGGDFSIAGQKLPVDASRRAGPEYNLQSHRNLH